MTIRLDHVTKTYPDGLCEIDAVADVSLEILAGEFIAVVGPSGSGKTTLLQIASALLAPTSGEVHLRGQAVANATADQAAALRRTWIGFAPQGCDLLVELTAQENVAIAAEIAGESRADSMDMAREKLDQVGLGDLCHRYPEELSGGQRQRAGLARAMVGDRAVLMADEPTANLDSLAAGEAGALLRLHASRGAAVLVATHDEELATMADRIVRMRDGHLVK